jgi:hypothetical protein
MTLPFGRFASCSSRHQVSSHGQQPSSSELRPFVRPSLCSYRLFWCGLEANGRWRKFDLYSSVLIRNWSADRRKAVLERGLLLGGLMNRRNPCYQTNFTRRGTCLFISHRPQQHHDCAHHEHFQRLCNRQWCCSHATVTVV